jgi:hypothetical protein
MKDRHLIETLYADVYKRIAGLDQSVCLYCGAPKQLYDHVPAISETHKRGTETLRKEGVRFLLVPCCADCNSTLGARSLWFIEERFDYLIKATDRTLNKLGAYWRKEEINELGRGLRDFIANNAHKRELMLTKLHELERRKLLFDLDKETLFKHSDHAENEHDHA